MTQGIPTTVNLLIYVYNVNVSFGEIESHKNVIFLYNQERHSDILPGKNVRFLYLWYSQDIHFIDVLLQC